ncbi:Ig-like domain-containing protein [Leadbettera azotonutricia]|uniref:Alpha-fucosidase n=1 Tax=Leadbettera azotonutricia (strain ATCC BAA-888 / DSM 13862 / ZAS-9) TaxID=545695 RepID=F5YDQ2_LEAAZ|nr:Ig-like domain-containing protein [Leadbettera azotonutricia]AEF83125.1 alpha-fucosidase [Leadbettera azotonutricia ZAS-9]
MKKTLAFVLASMILAVVLLMAACTSPFAPSFPTDGSAGKGRVDILFGTEDRSIVPDTNFDSYKFVFTEYEDDGITVIGASTYPKSKNDKPFSFWLSPGFYKVAVTAYKGPANENKIAATGNSGEVPFELKVSDNPKIVITLNGNKTTGTGSFYYKIDYPEGTHIIGFSLGETYITEEIVSGVAGEISLNAGIYRMVVRLQNHEGKTTGFGDLVEIYENNKTIFEKDFTEGNIVWVEPEYVAVTDIALTIDGVPIGTGPVELNLGDSITIDASVTPSFATNKTVTWSSSKEDIVTAVDGILTAKAAGSTTVTATAGDITKTINVTVINSYVPVTDITLPADADGNGEITISAEVGIPTKTAQVVPSNATAGTVIVWTAVNINGIDEVIEQGVVQENPSWRASNAGTYILRATVVDGIAVGTPFVKDFKITVNPITDIDTWHGLYIWPNASSVEVGSFHGKDDVIKVSPNAQGIYDWAPLRYDLTEFANASQEITVNVSFSYYIESANNGAKIRLQAIQKGPSYPVITGPSTATGSWQTSSGSLTFIPGYTDEQPYHGYLYIDESDSNGLNKKTVYLADFELRINGVIVSRPPITVESVSLNEASLELTVGDTEALTAEVLPTTADNKSVSWSSGDPTVATVTDGLVTAVGAGSTVITVTSMDGSKTAQATVTVVAAYVPVTGFSYTGGTSVTAGHSLVLSGDFTPGADAVKAGKAVTWAVVSGPATTSESTLTATGTAAGTVIVTASIADGTEIGMAYTSAPFTITVAASIGTGGISFSWANGAPVTDPAGPVTITLGQSVTLSAGTGITGPYQWLNGDNVIDGATGAGYTFTPAAKGNYSIGLRGFRSVGGTLYQHNVEIIVE